MEDDTPHHAPLQNPNILPLASSKPVQNITSGGIDASPGIGCLVQHVS